MLLTLITMSDINNIFNFIHEVAEVKYPEADTDEIIERFTINNPPMQEILQKLAKAMYDMVTEGIDPEIINKLLIENRIDAHLFETVFSRKDV